MQQPEINGTFWFDDTNAIQFQFRYFALYGSKFFPEPRLSTVMIIRARGDLTSRPFIEFLPPPFATATPGWHTRAVKPFFDWCDNRQLQLADVEAITVATCFSCKPSCVSTSLVSRLANTTIEPCPPFLAEPLGTLSTPLRLIRIIVGVIIGWR
jgi:hypothetical protein